MTNIGDGRIGRTENERGICMRSVLFIRIFSSFFPPMPKESKEKEGGENKGGGQPAPG